MLYLDAEAHVSTKPPEAEQDPRVPHADEDQIRAGGVVAPSRQRTQAGFGKARLPRVAGPFALIAQVPLSSLATRFQLQASGKTSGNLDAKLAAGSRRPTADVMSIPREHRLRKHAEFELVYKSGRRQFSSSFTAFYLLRPGTKTEGPRVGITVGRQLGAAVRRNRIKRRLRAAVGQNLERVTSAVDVVINPKKAVFDMDFGVLGAEIGRAFDAIAQKTASGREGHDPQSQATRSNDRPRAGSVAAVTRGRTQA